MGNIVPSTTKNNVFYAATRAFAIRGFGVFSSFLLTYIIARSLPTDESGKFFLSLATITFLSTAGMCGLNISALRFIGIYHSDKQWGLVSGTAFFILITSGLVLFLLSLCTYFSAPAISNTLFTLPDLAPVLRALSPAVFFVGLYTIVAHFLQATNCTSRSIFVLAIATPFGAAATLFIMPASDAVSTAKTYVLFSMFSLALGAWWWNSQSHERTSGVIPSGQILTSAASLWLISLMNQLTQWSGQLAAGYWANAEEVAYLAVAQRTAMLVSFVLVAVNLVVAPRFAALYNRHNYFELERLAANATRIMILIAFPALTLLLLFPEFVMSFFGSEYANGAFLLQILAIGQFVNVATGSVGYLLTMSGHERDVRNIVLLVGPVSLISALIFTSFYGVYGAAFSLSATTSLQNLAAVYFVRKRIGINTLLFWKSRTSHQ